MLACKELAHQPDHQEDKREPKRIFPARIAREVIDERVTTRLIDCVEQGVPIEQRQHLGRQ